MAFDRAKNYWQELSPVWKITSVCIIGFLFSILGAIPWAEERAFALFYPGMEEVQVNGSTVYQITNTHPAWLSFLGILFLYSLVYLSVLSVLYVRRSPTKTQELLQQETNDLRQELLSLMFATDKIANRLYEGGGQPDREFPLIEETYTIHKGGDLYAQRLFHIKAVKGNLRFWELGFGPDPKGTPLELISQLKFTAKDVSGNGEVVYLVSKNEPGYKKIVFFFLPAIKPTEKEPRKILVTYSWPGYWLKLLSDKWESSNLKMKSPVGHLRRTYKIESNLGRLTVTPITKVKGDSLTKYGPDDSGLTGWRYEADDCDVCDLSFRLKLSGN